MGGITDVPTVTRNLKSVFPATKRSLASDGTLVTVKTDNYVFRLSTNFTSVLFLLFAGLIFYQRVSNEHINCLTPPDEDVRTSAINQYCFVTGTYTIANYSGKLGKLQKHLPYPGVGPSLSPSQLSGTTKLKFHLYFQWVPFVIAIIAVLVRLPKVIWKAHQGDVLHRYCYLFGKPSLHWYGPPEKPGKEDHDEDNPAARMFVENMGYHKSYAIGFHFCELLNFFVLITSFLFTDLLLAGDFATLGSDWLRYLTRDKSYELSSVTQLDMKNPFDRVFPKMSKCEFRKFGPSGSIQNHDILCVLTLNVIHEKVFLFMWFWFFILGFLQLAGLFRATTFLLRNQRINSVKSRTERTFLDANFYSSNKDGSTRFRIEFNSKRFTKFASKLNYSDWFILTKISDNTNRLEFTTFLAAVIYLENQKAYDDSSRLREVPEEMRYPPPYPAEREDDALIANEAGIMAARYRKGSQGPGQLGSTYKELRQSLREIHGNADAVLEEQELEIYKQMLPNNSEASTSELIRLEEMDHNQDTRFRDKSFADKSVE